MGFPAPGSVWCIWTGPSFAHSSPFKLWCSHYPHHSNCNADKHVFSYSLLVPRPKTGNNFTVSVSVPWVSAQVLAHCRCSMNVCWLWDDQNQQGPKVVGDTAPTHDFSPYETFQLTRLVSTRKWKFRTICFLTYLLEWTYLEADLPMGAGSNTPETKRNGKKRFQPGKWFYSDVSQCLRDNTLCHWPGPREVPCCPVSDPVPSLNLFSNFGLDFMYL